MTETKINNPHDAYFRNAMSNLKVAQDFFKHHLPERILKQLDLTSLRVKKSSFIDVHLKNTMADMLYAVTINQQSGYLYLLVEHQRNPDKFMAYRLLRYTLRIMDEHLKENDNTTLPVIIPLVFYNGKKRYPYSTDLFDLFGDQQALARDTLCKPFNLIDVTQIPDEHIRAMKWAGIMELAQKHIFARDFQTVFEKYLVPLLDRLRQEPDSNDYFNSSLTYVFQADIENLGKIGKLLGQASVPLRDEIMSLAQKLEQKGFDEGIHKGIEQGRVQGIEQGRAQGIDEGMHKGIETIASNMLAQNADPIFVSKMTGISLDAIKAIQARGKTEITPLHPSEPELDD